ncbi:hypothetical protein MLD38_037150 [Melastoma candidum]|uniref:Uncharacterized protein n=2 Tax=Melastoma candidum TaxID=119954 RepID=A0ACB9LM42_9MYRT|nr:hypothetical protein MLD38_037141 [Melastoma candidum]KAI4312331.1 hypothetical protein MLD38_037150 [Melastoma candidum]
MGQVHNTSPFPSHNPNPNHPLSFRSSLSENTLFPPLPQQPSFPGMPRPSLSSVSSKSINSLDDGMMNDQRFGSQERENTA